MNTFIGFSEVSPPPNKSSRDERGEGKPVALGFTGKLLLIESCLINNQETNVNTPGLYLLKTNFFKLIPGTIRMLKLI